MKKLFTVLLPLLLIIPSKAMAAPLIGLNAHGHDVVVLQKTLAKLNYGVSATNGNFDLATENALKAFQQDHQLPVTGKVDRSTWQLIRQATGLTPAATPKNLPVVNKQAIPNRNSANTMQQPIEEVKKTTATQNVEPIKPVSKPIPAVQQGESKKPNGTVKAKPQATTKTKTKKNNKKANKNKKTKKPSTNFPSRPLSKNTAYVPMGKEFISRQTADKIINTAKKFLGTPYSFGGNTPKGFDCSGYLEYVFALNGLTIPRTADEQYNLGRLLPLSKLQPGDLVFFTTYEPGASHCGIYLGNKKFIHASTSRGVIIDDMSNEYWTPRYYGGKKIIK